MPGSPSLQDWQGAPKPHNVHASGRFVRCEPFDPDRHAAELFDACAGRDDLWEFIGWGPFSSVTAFRRHMAALTADPAWHYFALCDLVTGQAIGKASWMRMEPAQGVMEVGGIVYSPALQRTPAATEAMILLMRWAFAQGYRRYEWKCDARNLPSRRAAQRLGFSFEGIFRQHLVVKGKNRDTAWFAVTDQEWPALSEAYDIWLSPENFEPDGTQRERLSTLTSLVRVSADPAL